MSSLPVPAQFEPLSRSSPFLDLLQPIYSKQELDNGAKKLIIGFRCEPKHCNARGFVHGGVLCTLADIALGYNCVLATDSNGGMVTSNLTMDFVGSAKIDDWVEIQVDVQKVGGTLAFANCYFWIGEKRIARASAVFCRPRSTDKTS